tara:strand:- start:1177 stop:2697 length:1521 start_codon:yes stop_codon:yes gene_type:complete
MATEFYNRNWRMPNSWNGSTDNNNKVSNYSMTFDGSSEYIDLGNDVFFDTNNPFTFSAWINLDSYTTNYPYIANLKTNVTNGFAIFLSNTGSYTGVNIGSTDSNITKGKTTGDISSTFLNSWNHIAIIYNGSGANTLSNYSIYVNGSSITLTTTGSFSTITNVNNLGRSGSGSFYFDGKIDHLAIFDYALSSSQVTSLYGNSTDGVGNPMELSTKPVAYYKIGDKAAFNGSEYLVTNSASEVYSPYALDFDGTDDKIETGISTGTNDVSISYWMKTTATHSYLLKQCAFGGPDSTFGTDYSLGLLGSHVLTPNDTKVRIFNSLGSTKLNDGNWHHVAFTYDYTTKEVKAYVDGSLDLTTTVSLFRSKTILIGSAGSSLFFTGAVSQCALFNSVLTSSQVTELYNQGKPGNLNSHSAYSNLVSWWQLGENSSFDGTNWTVLDEKGTNNGTSVNMAEDDLVNGVGTTGNGLSDGMGGADNIVGEAPYSTANAVSYGMGADAKSTSVPS